MNKIKEFEDYLKDFHAEEYLGTDDDMPDAFDDWMNGLGSDEWLAYGDRALDLQEKGVKEPF